ncbi:hypothetical protein LSH36_399g04017 [Paralvinella palmiformis]|uniref:Menorin-like domain-containing protein n=1 Tax=Paralvinella palmiformis TaxID=53620 RepID=A0AAD9JDG3_9ANNE|nr:hypothetical protein LSH36_399g04017 [Paralvinella palmiformis]
MYRVIYRSTLFTVADGRSETVPSMGSVLDYFGVQDPLDVTWYHGANSIDQMQQALDGSCDMLEGDVTLRWHGFPNQTEEPIMAHPPQYDSDNTLDNWLNHILATNNKAPKIDFKVEDCIEPSLKILSSKSEIINKPIWINADVLEGPGSDNQPIDPYRFIELVEKYIPNITLSLGWTTGCCDDLFTMPMMEEMWTIVHNLTQPCNFPVRAALLKGSWLQFKWLLENDVDRFSLTVWAPNGSLDWEGATPYDILYVRNDIDKRYVYYDLPGPRLEEFRRLCITAGSPLNHFDLNGTRDGLLVTWAHAVNSEQELKSALMSDAMMLEADVLLEGQGTVNQTDTPIMAHPPNIYSDITLERWLEITLNTSRGIKLDFKSVEVLDPSLRIVSASLSRYQQPIWLNADIFSGPNAEDSTPLNATIFRETVLQFFPEATLSVGWTTADGPEGYTRDMVDEMLAFVAPLQQPVTFPVRAKLVKRSWDNLKELLSSSRAHALTIWSGSDLVDPDDLVYVRENSDLDRVYYDLPTWLMDLFLERLNSTCRDSPAT